jgi:hypothetical protein
LGYWLLEWLWEWHFLPCRNCHSETMAAEVNKLLADMDAGKCLCRGWCMKFMWSWRHKTFLRAEVAARCECLSS